MAVRLHPLLFLTAFFGCTVAPLAAQSPNTGTMIVAVVDQTGAAVAGAKVTAVNTEPGAKRDAVSDHDGRATIPALPLTGKYTVRVSRTGFGNEEINDVTLRS